MKRINCDRCEKPFEVDDSAVGTKVECPYCGDVNRIEDAAALEPEDAAERELLVTRPAMVRAHPITFMIMMLVICGGIAAAVYAFTKDIRWAGYAMLAVSLGGLIWAAIWYLNFISEGVRITTRRTIYRRGLLSKYTTEVLHQHIRNVQVNQTLWQRIWNVGDLRLDSSAGGGGPDLSAEIRVRNVPRPARLQEIIDRYRDL